MGRLGDLDEEQPWHARVVQRRRRLPSLPGRLQRSRLQHDWLRDERELADLPHEGAHGVVGRQPEPERCVRAGDPCAVDAVAHRAERPRRPLGEQRRPLGRQHAAVDDLQHDELRRQQQERVLAARRHSLSGVLVALVPCRVLSRLPRAEPRGALSQAGEHDDDHDPEPVPQGGERRGTRGGLRLAADRLAPGEGHVLRRGLQQLQRPDDPLGDVDAVVDAFAAPLPRAARG